MLGAAVVEAESGVCGKSKGAAYKGAWVAYMNAKKRRANIRINRFISSAFMWDHTRV